MLCFTNTHTLDTIWNLQFQPTRYAWHEDGLNLFHFGECIISMNIRTLYLMVPHSFINLWWKLWRKKDSQEIYIHYFQEYVTSATVSCLKIIIFVLRHKTNLKTGPENMEYNHFLCVWIVTLANLFYHSVCSLFSMQCSFKYLYFIQHAIYFLVSVVYSACMEFLVFSLWK